jgi:hypothetical protein
MKYAIAVSGDPCLVRASEGCLLRLEAETRLPVAKFESVRDLIKNIPEQTDILIFYHMGLEKWEEIQKSFGNNLPKVLYMYHRCDRDLPKATDRITLMSMMESYDAVRDKIRELLLLRN